MKKQRITDVDEIKKIEVGILDYVVKICVENNLKYFLAYGTLLGAVRHKGIIPWDDDIDICMPRNDYKRLCDIWKEQCGSFRLLECSKNKGYMYPFAKVYDSRTLIIERDVTETCHMGIYIDIFPYDGLKGGPDKDRAFIKQCELLEKLRVYSMFPVEKFAHRNAIKNIGRKMLWILLKIWGCRRIARVLDKKVQRDSVEDSKWAGCLVTQDSKREIMPREWFEEETELLFEGKYYKAPKEYDKILKTNYGNYMELPPIEKRVLAHGFQAFKILEG